MCYNNDDENGCGFGLAEVFHFYVKCRQRYSKIWLNELFKNESMSTAFSNLYFMVIGGHQNKVLI